MRRSINRMEKKTEATTLATLKATFSFIFFHSATQSFSSSFVQSKASQQDVNYFTLEKQIFSLKWVSRIFK